MATGIPPVAKGDTDMPYEVINLDTDESHGVYDTLEEARGCVAFDRLRAYSIWRGRLDDESDGGEPVEFIGIERVECCEPYDGDDDRARQGLGESPWEQPS